ncbi:MAG: hypothetical protein ABR582_14710 [Gemmatimonadaceae bacterium]
MRRTLVVIDPALGPEAGKKLMPIILAGKKTAALEIDAAGES